jgi:hypothetical protein
MTVAAYTTLLPDILPHVVSCPMPSIQRAIQIVAQDYFQRSQAYTYDLAATSVILNQSEVTVILPANTRLVVPLTLYLNGELLATTNHSMLSLEFGDWTVATAAIPKYVMVHDSIGDKLVLALKSNGAYSLTGRVAVKPTRAAVSVEEEQLETHGDAIVDGVLGRMMMMKNTEWYDGQLASFHMNEYERAIDEAHNVSTKGNTSRGMTTGYGGV